MLPVNLYVFNLFLKNCFALQSCDRFVSVKGNNAQQFETVCLITIIITVIYICHNRKQKLYNWAMEKKQKIAMKKL